MRVILFLLALLPLLAPTGCAATPAAPLLVAEGAAITVFGRGIVDIGVSAITGRDCSLVRLDRGLTYCAPTDQPVTEPYCTRTLARVDCWDIRAQPAHLRPGVGDTPPPSASQAAWRRAPWPKSLAVVP